MSDRRNSIFSRFAIGLIAALAVTSTTLAQSRLSVAPTSIQLTGPRRTQRLVVTLTGDLGARDLTEQATFKSTNRAVADVSTRGVITPRGNGTVDIIVTAGKLSTKSQVVVSQYEQLDLVDFHSEVIASLSRGGCSQGACHGSPQGKGGFRLSLRGFEPELDFDRLTREENGRRVNRLDPLHSLILQKALAKLPHQGGRRFRKTDEAFALLQAWVTQGHIKSDEPPQLLKLQVLPEKRQLHTDSPHQQLLVLAHFDNGSIRDVTDLAVFSTIESSDYRVSPEGRIEFRHTADAAVLVRYLDRIVTSRLTYIRRDPNFKFVAPKPANVIDQLVFSKQRQLQLRPSGLGNDEVFLRRLYLDVIGGLPTAEEARRFIDSKDPDKRARLIDRLLRRKEFAQFWALKWADVMRGNRETISERGVHVLHRYLKNNFATDRPFDKVAEEMITSLGNTIHEPAASFYRVARTPTDAAESLSQLFLGVRIGCAKCHNHPYESITQRDYYSLAASFARVRLKGQRFGLDDETVFLAPSGDVKMPNGSAIEPAAFGYPLKSSGNAHQADRRRALAAWLTRSDNRYFARSTVNRIWFHLMGQGIVEPIDDFRDSNPPSNPELLDALANEFVRSGYRFKPVIRLILNSRVYQLSPRQNAKQSPFAANSDRYFTKPTVKMLNAEQLIDAISSATGVPEHFPGYPLGTKAVALAEGAVEHKFLKAFTKPVRDVACDCARETEPTMNQIVHLLNNPDLLEKIDSPKSRLGRWLAAKKRPRDIIQLMYLATLSRRPSDRELQIATGHIRKAKSPREGLRDLQHALLNTNEFLLRH